MSGQTPLERGSTPSARISGMAGRTAGFYLPNLLNGGQYTIPIAGRSAVITVQDPRSKSALLDPGLGTLTLDPMYPQTFEVMVWVDNIGQYREDVGGLLWLHDEFYGGIKLHLQGENHLRQPFNRLIIEVQNLQWNDPGFPNIHIPIVGVIERWNEREGDR